SSSRSSTAAAALAGPPAAAGPPVAAASAAVAAGSAAAADSAAAAAARAAAAQEAAGELRPAFMTYSLYYWPSIQGRGEFVRLALEDAGAGYVDVARKKNGVELMLKKLKQLHIFAPPFLCHGKVVV